MKWNLAAVLVLSCGIHSAGAATSGADAYPDKPIRLIVPFAPGGSTDIMGRILAQKITEAWGQQVVVDNRGGAGTVIGTEIAARAAADGYTILLVNIAFAINPGLRKKLPYDPVKHFATVSLLASQPTVLAAHPSVTAKSVKELIELAKARPGQLTFASSGTGGVGHLAGELFKMMTGTKLTHVPYKGGGPAVIDLIAGQVNLALVGLPTSMSHIKAGRMRVLAVTDDKRATALPEVPTIAEAGVPGYEVNNWIGMLVPAGAPKTIVTRHNRELLRILRLPEVKEKLAGQGFELVGSTPERFADYIKAEIRKWAKVIEASGTRVD
ncbi:MAG: tripartite tricarboxylate transporter substrate binding protein [Betaproteobacteria bacterium]|nr:tripartite tricarboxylate transporter substrate binding protein [Betaproteobacteria bacterium]